MPLSKASQVVSVPPLKLKLSSTPLSQPKPISCFVSDSSTSTYHCISSFDIDDSELNDNDGIATHCKHCGNSAFLCHEVLHGIPIVAAITDYMESDLNKKRFVSRKEIENKYINIYSTINKEYCVGVSTSNNGRVQFNRTIPSCMHCASLQLALSMADKKMT